MDIKDRVMGDQPHDFLHKLAGIVPGYHGYVDRERRRDADRLLRTQLAHKYSEQNQRLARVQQTLLRGHDLDNINQIDRLGGNLQRFIDRLQNATYGYAGLFDPVKVEAADLDQLYAFDMSLASGVDTISSAIDSLEAAASGQGKAELPAAIDRLSSAIDDLQQRFNQRQDLLTNGTRLPDSDYRSMLSDIQAPAGGAGAATTAGAGSTGSSTGGTQGASYSSANSGPSGTTVSGSTGQVPGGPTSGPAPAYPGVTSDTPSYPGVAGAPTVSTSGGSGSVSVEGAGAPTGPINTAGIAGSGASSEDATSPTSGGPVVSSADGQHTGALLPADEPSVFGSGTETTGTNMTANLQHDPAVNSMAEGNQGFAGTPIGGDRGGSSPITLGGSAGTGVESASTPSVAPGAPAGDVVDGMSLANNLDSVAGADIPPTGGTGPINPPGAMGGETQT